ncbi:MAG: hypothetical protein BWY91_00904 [bacterium ADurb.BinA028]|nr:MAG: hypothetical protein BWY91_00904 [bacterium ADurb.BinA028]
MLSVVAQTPGTVPTVLVSSMAYGCGGSPQTSRLQPWSSPPLVLVVSSASCSVHVPAAGVPLKDARRPGCSGWWIMPATTVNVPMGSAAWSSRPTFITCWPPVAVVPTSVKRGTSTLVGPTRFTSRSAMRACVSWMLTLTSWIDAVTVPGTVMVEVTVPAPGPMVLGTSVLVKVVQFVCAAFG